MAKRKDKSRREFWKKLHFKYKVSIINESTLEEVWKLRTSRFWGGFLVIGFAFFMIVITSVIIIQTPIRNYLPGYLDSEIRESATRAAIRTDSLEKQLLYQQVYLQNLQNIFEGKVQIDSIKSVVDTVFISEDDKSLKRSDLEKKYTDKFEEDEKYNLSVLPSASDAPAEGISFFRPAKGLISQKFNTSARHFGVNIVAAPKESVLATQEGTVIFVGFDAEAGHVIQIQHKNGFVSVYKNNAMLLKKVGDKVRTGEAIAIVGDKGESQKGSVLHFELWHKGSPVNPETYISF